MSYPEKRSLVSLLSGIIVLAAYVIYTNGQVRAGGLAADDLRQWALVMLVFIGLGIVLTIIVQILFHIFLSIFKAIHLSIKGDTCSNDDIEQAINSEMVTDEMDRLIELKSMRVGFIAAGIGFVSGLVSLVVGLSPALMLNIMFGSLYLGSMLEGLMQLYYYRKGVSHG